MLEQRAGTHITDNGNNKEARRGKEVLKANFGVVVIFGVSGAGKTAAANSLGEALNIPPSSIIKAGQNVRAVGLDRDTDVDRAVDEYSKALIKGADISNPIILEARLGGYLATRVLTKTPNVPVARVLFTASKDIRTNRIWGRRVEEIKMKIKSADTSDEEKEAIIDMLANRELTKKFIEDEESRRDERDRGIWSGLYPELLGIDLFDPKITIAGRKMWDIVINTSNLSKEKTEEVLIAALIRIGWIKTAKPPRRNFAS